MKETVKGYEKEAYLFTKKQVSTIKHSLREDLDIHSKLLLAHIETYEAILANIFEQDNEKSFYDLKD